jgi:hypothetical protein
MGKLNNINIKLDKIIMELDYLLDVDENNKEKILNKFNEIYNELYDIHTKQADELFKSDNCNLDHYYNLLGIIEKRIKFCNDILKIKDDKLFLNFENMIESAKSEILFVIGLRTGKTKINIISNYNSL